MFEYYLEGTVLFEKMTFHVRQPNTIIIVIIIKDTM